MVRSWIAILWGSLLSLSLSLGWVATARAVPIVWTGSTINFQKAGADPSDPMDPLNQDRLTDHVWLTRGADDGMFNIVPTSNDLVFGDPGYVRFTSPDDTLWATSVMAANTGETIAASNFAQLSFTTWAAAYGGPGSDLRPNITTHNAVVHLLTDDIYLDLNFTSFDSSGNFSYQRSTAGVPEPSAGFAALAGVLLLGCWRRMNTLRC